MSSTSTCTLKGFLTTEFGTSTVRVEPDFNLVAKLMSSYKVVCCCTVTTPNSSVILALGFTFKTKF